MMTNKMDNQKKNIYFVGAGGIGMAGIGVYVGDAVFHRAEHGFAAGDNAVRLYLLCRFHIRIASGRKHFCG